MSDKRCPKCAGSMEPIKIDGRDLWGCRPCGVAVSRVGSTQARLDQARKLAMAVARAEGEYGRLAPVAEKLIALLDRDPERAIPMVLGRVSPTGRPTLESLLRTHRPARQQQKKTKAREVGWDSEDVRAGITDYDPGTRPGEPLTIIDQGPEGGPSEPSSSFPYHPLKHAELNAVQSLVLPWVDRDVNIVVAAKTSAGKSIIAEMLIGGALHRGGKGIFLSPLRAVSQEKYDDWTEDGHPWAAGVQIMTGDYDMTEARKKAIRAARVIVMTSEMLDARSRRLHNEQNDWLLKTLMIVADEAHLLTMEGRGDALECGLMRFAQQNPQSRICLLSATMPNVTELGQWLTCLNGKPSVVIRSLWRPTTLTVHWCGYVDRGTYDQKEEAKRNRAMKVLAEHPTDKFIVFVHSKTAGRRLLANLRARGEHAEFHNADLDRSHRLDLERRFKDEQGGVRVIIATSTLAYGINMPARRVIVLGIHRGMEEVDPIDVQQEIGRAGRYGIDPEGDAYILLPSSRFEMLKARYSAVGPIGSQLKKLDPVAFHLCAEVETRTVSTPAEAVLWHSRSLAAIQGRPMVLTGSLDLSGEDQTVPAEEVMETLAKRGIFKATAYELCGACGAARTQEVEGQMVCDQGHRAPPKVSHSYEITMLGRVASWLYFSPFDVADWASNFRRLIETDRTKDNASIAWALGCTKTANENHCPRDLDRLAMKLSTELMERNTPTTRTNPTMVGLYAILKGYDVPEVQPIARAIRHDIDRVLQAVGLIDQHVLKGLGTSYASLLGARIRHGVSWREAELCRLPGIGGKRARTLVAKGIRTISDVYEQGDRVTRILGRIVGAEAVRAAKSMLRQERGRD